MGNVIISTAKLTKEYKKEKAVDNVNMRIYEGDIYGLIGKNGAGKTTLMKMISGIIYPTSGSMSLFGTNDKKEIIQARRKIGISIENPALYENMNAYDNLKYINIMYGIKSDDNIKRILTKVGLDPTSKKKVALYSLGMKQRLAIAIALINDPKLLILDEPINGLDPEGIHEVRDLLLQLNTKEKITILISSHILGELEKLATRYGIMSNGELVKEMDESEIRNIGITGIVVRVDNVFLAKKILEEKLSLTNVSIKGSEVTIKDCKDIGDKINIALTSQGVKVKEIKTISSGIEDFFDMYSN